MKTRNSQASRWIGIGALMLALPMVVAAQSAYTRGSPTLFAGPSADYPAVARLASGQPLQVMGCTNGYGWCDVVLPDGLRGWVAANRLDYDYDGDSVPLATYGATIGVPIIGFALGNYWNNYYRDRPWYREPRWWGNRPPPPPVPGWRPPPPPAAAWQPRQPAPGWNAPPGRPGWAAQPQRPDWNRQPQRPDWNNNVQPQRPAWDGQRSGQPHAQPQQPPPTAMPRQPPMPPQVQVPHQPPAGGGLPPVLNSPQFRPGPPQAVPTRPGENN